MNVRRPFPPNRNHNLRVHCLTHAISANNKKKKEKHKMYFMVSALARLGVMTLIAPFENGRGTHNLHYIATSSEHTLQVWPVHQNNNGEV